jgi:hypothetical protein
MESIARKPFRWLAGLLGALFLFGGISFAIEVLCQKRYWYGLPLLLAIYFSAMFLRVAWKGTWKSHGSRSGENDTNEGENREA